MMALNRLKMKIYRSRFVASSPFLVGLMPPYPTCNPTRLLHHRRLLLRRIIPIHQLPVLWLLTHIHQRLFQIASTIAIVIIALVIVIVAVAIAVAI